MELIQKSLVSSPDNTRTMTPEESFESNVADTGYAINALSNPSDDTYRKNLARYLDTKGFDLVSKDRQLFIGDRNSMNMKPVTKSFMGDMIGSGPEIVGSILGAGLGSTLGPAGTIGGGTLGSTAGDAVQQFINSYMLGEELTTDERMMESGKSAMLGAGGEVAGNLIGRAITPLRGINKSAQSANTELAGKYGVELTPATATGHTGLSNFEELMSKGSLGGKSIAKAKETEITGIEGVATDLLEGKMGGTGNAYDSGSSLAYNVDKKQGIAQEFFNNKYGELVKAADVTEIPMTSLKGVAQEIVAKSEKIPAFKNGIDNFAQRLLDSPENLTYQEYQELRSFIGAKIKDASVTGQTGSKAAYKQLYGAINNDFDDIFRGTSFWDTKKQLDTDFKRLYKEPFEDSFTKGVLGTSRNKIDPERVGGLIANSSGKAKTAMNTADSGFAEAWTPEGTSAANKLLNRKPYESMKSAADSVLGKSTAPDGGMSLAKTRTNLKKASGIDTLLKKSDGFTKENLMGMKSDIIKLIELSGQNKKVANHSGTAWMNEMLKMKNDLPRALIGFITDTGMSMTYNRKMFQKWLTNGTISKPQYQQLINASTQVAERTIDE